MNFEIEHIETEIIFTYHPLPIYSPHSATSSTAKRSQIIPLIYLKNFFLFLTSTILVLENISFATHLSMLLISFSSFMDERH